MPCNVFIYNTSDHDIIMKYTDLLFRGRTVDNQKSTKTISWSDKLVDPCNYWLKAVNKEEEHEYEIAADSYLKDAIVSFDRRSFNRAALSCSVPQIAFLN